MVSTYRKEFSKSWVTPKFGPHGGSNFQVGPHCAPSGGQIYANIAVLLCPFGRTLNTLKNALYLGHQPLTKFVPGGLEDCNFCWMSHFQRESAQKWCNVSRVFCIGLIESKVLHNFWKKFRRRALRFWSYSNLNIGDHNVCAHIYCKNL